MVLRRLIIRVILCIIVVFVFSSNTHAQGTGATYTSWSPDNSYIVVARGHDVQVLDTASWQMVWQQTVLWEQIAQPRWSPDGTKLAIGNGSVLEIWSGVERNEQASLELSLQAASPIHAFAWHPQGDRVALVTHALEVWDLPSATLLYRVYENRNIITDVAWRANGTQIATSSVDFTVKLWDAATGIVTQTMTLLRDTNLPVSEIFTVPTSITWKLDEPLLVFGVEDGTVRLWDTEALSAAEVRMTQFDAGVMSAGSVQIASVDVNDLGVEVAAGAIDGRLTIFDIDTGEMLQSHQTHLSLDSVSYSQYGGRLLISGGAVDNTNSALGGQVIIDVSLVNGAVQIVVPDPSLERLQSIANLCNAPLTLTEAIPDTAQTEPLTDFVAQVEALPADSIPPACAADLIAVAQAIPVGQ